MNVNMNVMPQITLGSVQGAASNPASVNVLNGMGFGAVFNAITTQLGSQVNVQLESMDMGNPEEILSISNATSMDELSEDIQQLVQSLMNQTENTEENEEPLQYLMKLLEIVGQGHKDEKNISSDLTIWELLQQIDQVAPQFFNDLFSSLKGEGNLPKAEAIDILALLKGIELSAPKMDLVVTQEQQFFSLGNFLTEISERITQVVPKPTHPPLVQRMESQQVARFLIHMETTQSNTDTGNSNEGAKETTQQAVSNHTGVVTQAKNEVSFQEVENRSNTRNEALLREIQTIFKRSNFGQTNGTNRLLIKLYPEHLGQVRIELLETNGILTARILASTALGKEMLDSQLNQLRNAFLQQNLQVERIDISQTLQDANRSNREQQAFNQSFTNDEQEKNERNEQNAEDEMTFQEFLIELEV